MKKLVSLLLAVCMCLSTILIISSCSAVCSECVSLEENGLAEKYGAVFVSTTATCSKGGVEKWKCKECEKEYEKTVEAYGHKWSATEKDRNENVTCETCQTDKWTVVGLDKIPETVITSTIDDTIQTPFQICGVDIVSINYDANFQGVAFTIKINDAFFTNDLENTHFAEANEKYNFMAYEFIVKDESGTAVAFETFIVEQIDGVIYTYCALEREKTGEKEIDFTLPNDLAHDKTKTYTVELKIADEVVTEWGTSTELIPAQHKFHSYEYYSAE